MELEGRPTTGLQHYYTAKSQWKRKMKREFRYIETVFNRIRLHQITSLGELYERAHRLKDIAAYGYGLIVAGSKLKVEERVHRDTVRVMRTAEEYSVTLRGRCEALNYPTRTFPSFLCEVQLPGEGLEGGDNVLAEAELENILGS